MHNWADLTTQSTELPPQQPTGAEQDWNIPSKGMLSAGTFTQLVSQWPWLVTPWFSKVLLQHSIRLPPCTFDCQEGSLSAQLACHLCTKPRTTHALIPGLPTASLKVGSTMIPTSRGSSSKIRDPRVHHLPMMERHSRNTLCPILPFLIT